MQLIVAMQMACFLLRWRCITADILDNLWSLKEPSVVVHRLIFYDIRLGLKERGWFCEFWTFTKTHMYDLK